MISPSVLVARPSPLLQIARTARPRGPSRWSSLTPWPKTRSVLKGGARDVDTTGGSPRLATARTREHQLGGVVWRVGPAGLGSSGRPAAGLMPWIYPRGAGRDGRPDSPPLTVCLPRRSVSMLKPLTLSLSLAVALGACSVSMAGPFHGGGSGCSTCGLASPQGAVPSAQAPVVPSAQCEAPSPCGGRCMKGPRFHWPKPTYCYEWVLKKKRVWGCHAPSGCETCGPAVYPSAQGVIPSLQAYGGGQTYVSGQAYGAAQAAPTSGQITPGPAPSPGEEAPPAPEVAPAAPAAPGAAPAPAAPAPPAPAPPAPPAPAPPATAPTSSLLFSTPAGN